MSDKYAGPIQSTQSTMKKRSYGATDAENQNNALKAGAYDINKDLPAETGYSTPRQHRTMKMTTLKKQKMADKAPKIDVRKGYSEGY